jgi:flagellar biosynthesis/type III secretory pathway chaperone
MLNDSNKLVFSLKINELISVWKNFCQTYTTLYDLTCEEYLYLLESDIDTLERTLETKNTLLDSIAILDLKRVDLLKDLGDQLNLNFNSLSYLTEVLKNQGLQAEARQLDGCNALLLDIIYKTQEQNKKNQVFLNRAIISLQDLRQNFSGKKNYKTYGANGVTKASVSP